MTMLAALARAYDRMEGLPRPGYSTEKISCVISLNPDGSVALVADLRVEDGRKRQPRSLSVPQGVKRTVGILPNQLWDKSAYVLGVTAGEGRRTGAEHEAFKARQRELFSNSDDEGLVALLRFLESWTPEQFQPPLWPDDMKDSNIVFALESDRLDNVFLHDRPEVRARIMALSAGAEEGPICLIEGTHGPVARLHPAIKNIWGGQSSGGSIVSFNAPSYESYGHSQGENAQISELAAFKYTTALNAFLAGTTNRLQIGDASTVFWADASGAATRALAEATFLAIASGVNEDKQAEKVGIVLDRIRKGVPWLNAASDLVPDLAPGVRFHVLGLAPNAARISVRFWYEDDFGALAENYRRFVDDLRIEPAPPNIGPPTLRRLLARLAPATRDAKGRLSFDSDRLPHLLVSDVFRTLLTDDRFPGMLLGQLLQRIRSDGVLDHSRLSLIKATIVRAMRKEGRLPLDATGKHAEDYLVRSDPDDPNPARRLGRLFALVERAQSAALGSGINSSITDKFLGTCAATPQHIVPKLVLDAQEHHLKRLRNGHSDADWIKDAEQAKRVGAALNRDIGRLFASFENGFPAQHSSEEQGLFLVGYYQERFGRTAGADDGAPPSDVADTDDITTEGQ
jgi:CRISPR-associated protein Csd1